MHNGSPAGPVSPILRRVGELPPRDPSVVIRVRGDLNDFLPERLRDRPIRRPIVGRPAVKDVIEATGIPHPEVGRVLVNGRHVPLSHRVEAGDEVAVGPKDASALPWRNGAIRFALDGHLGRLAAYLRMAGFDTWYERDATDERLAALSAAEDRILLTRDLGLLRRGVVRRGAFVRSDRPPEQLAETLARFGLIGAVAPFGRCLRCNAPLDAASRSDVAALVPPRVLREQPDFRRCPGCGGVYWRGSHHRRMERLLAEAIAAARARARAKGSRAHAADVDAEPPGSERDPAGAASPSG
jgi:uncharacterized protein